MADRSRLIGRKATPLVVEALADTRVVTINGARQAGKRTLARLVAAGSTRPLIRLLDDPATPRAAQDDPAGFVDHDGLLVIPAMIFQISTWSAARGDCRHRR